MIEGCSEFWDATCTSNWLEFAKNTWYWFVFAIIVRIRL